MVTFKDNFVMGLSIFSIVVLATWTGATIFRPVSADPQTLAAIQSNPYFVSPGLAGVMPDASLFHQNGVVYLLQIDGVDGESTDKTCKNCIEVNSFSWGVSNQSSIGSATGGAGAGKATFNEISFVHKVDKASPILMMAVATGKHYPKATLYVRKAGDKQLDYMKIEMNEILVSSYQNSGATDNVPVDSISFSFGKISYNVKSASAGFDIIGGGVVGAP